jgi:hypothetical protein
MRCVLKPLGTRAAPPFGLLFGTTHVQADGDPRGVHIPNNAEALLQHFGIADRSCYTLAFPEEAVRLGVTDLKAYNQNHANVQVGPKRTNYDIDPDITFNGMLAYTIGQCFTSDNRIKCGGACDMGAVSLL